MSSCRNEISPDALAVPVMILVAKDGLQAVMPMVAMSIVLGTLIGISGKYIVRAF